jgi:hypothetical protein
MVNKGLSGRLYPAVVHAPFHPVGYVLIDGHLLLPATWHDPEQAAPGVGGPVVVNELPWPLPPGVLPLVAYPAPPEPESAPESAPVPEEVPMKDKSPEALEES